MGTLRRERIAKKKERKKTDNPREGWASRVPGSRRKILFPISPPPSERRVGRRKSSLLKTMSCGDETAWQDQSIVCGDCKVLIDRSVNYYSTCDMYCTAIGRVCTQGYQNTDGCSVPDNITSPITCDTWIQSSNAICECGAPSRCDICPESTYKSNTTAGYGCCLRLSGYQDNPPLPTLVPHK